MNKIIINFGKFETSAVLINVFLVKIFLGLPGELQRMAAQAGWLVTIISSMLFLAVLFFIFRFINSACQKEMPVLLEDAYGNRLGRTFTFILAITFLLKAALSIKISSEILINILPFELPVTVCLILLTGGALICALGGIEGIVRIHAIFVPLILVAFLFTCYTSFFAGDINNLFPLFGFGAKNILTNGLKYTSIFSDFIYIFLLMPYVKSEKVFKNSCFSSVVISGTIFVAVSFFYAIAVPFPVGTKLFMPIYQVSRFASFSANSQGFEAFLIPEWIISSLLYISLTVFFAGEFFKNSFNIKRRGLAICASSVFSLILSFIPKNLHQASLIGTNFINYVVIFSSIFAFFSVLIAKRKDKGIKNG